MWSKLGQCACTRYGGRTTIPTNLRKQRWRLGLPRPGRTETGGVGLEAFAFRSVPTLNSGRRPLVRFVSMTVDAGVWSAEFNRSIGTRHAEAMVMAAIDAHVGAFGHVACRESEHRA